MKAFFRLFAGLLIGIFAGLAIAAVITVVFTDTALPEFRDRILSTDGVEIITAAFAGVVSFVISLTFLIPVHEAGHLVCGLLTGYGFVSFRIFNLTFIKINGKIRIKKFAIAGTGGQCLLSPPDMPVDQIPTGWYNAGGVLANILVLLLALSLFFLNLHPLATEALAVFCLTDIFLILMNGIPMKLNGISNDAYNIIHLNHSPLSKRAIIMQLRTNSLIQNGMRPKDMPDEWFGWHTDIDYKNPLEVSFPLMHASRLVDKMQWEEAYQEFDELYSHKDEIMQLYVNEIACELTFCGLVMGRRQQAEELLDSKLRHYIDEYKNVMSSKQRLSSAIVLYIEGDRTKAEDIYRRLYAERHKYLLEGEVKSDLAIMQWMFGEQNLPTSSIV